MFTQKYVYALFIDCRIYALFVVNPPGCQNWMAWGSSQFWQCKDFESAYFVNTSLGIVCCAFGNNFALTEPTLPALFTSILSLVSQSHSGPLVGSP